MVYWATLPRTWELEDVQAVLNVIITTLGGVTIYVFTRSCWLISGRLAAKGNAVPVTSLLSVNTPGEAIDALNLLRSHVLRHWRILVQCIMVIALSLLTVLSGPIAKYSTQMTLVTIQTEVNGNLALGHNSMADSQVVWNLTQESLDYAEFPTDQLLDYLPDTTTPWIYRPEEWNNTWSMACDATESTPVDLTLTENCTSFESKFAPSLPQIFPQAYFGEEFFYNFGDYYVNNTYIQDLLVIMYGANYSDFEESTGTWRTISLSIGALHVHGIPKNDSDWTMCRFGEGEVERASYTRIDCRVKRDRGTFGNAFFGAYPDTWETGIIPSSFVANFFPQFKQEAIEDMEISPLTPRRLQRFYQVYVISKDTQGKLPVRRPMSVNVVAVQLSTVFIAVVALLTLFNCLAGATYGLSLLYKREALASVPQSKLDWLLQSITSNNPLVRNGAYALPVAMTSPGRQAEEGRRVSAETKRARFEGAVYDARWAEHSQPSPDFTTLTPGFPPKMGETRYPAPFYPLGPS
ncbi:hypothetical protein PV04_01058 [Phialophora macrospora]|uniref:Uncharacterized protein n=1 Tax=Phialophora macrospora TaxID=1851006 RepID=A0A0D2EF08_9EURO|nr:hypothetical protein PV04_01058 [Phialophora macrospora]